MNEIFMNRVKEYRKRLCMTQQEFAEVTNTSKETIGRLERGYQCYSYEVAYKIARYLQEPMEVVFYCKKV